MFCVLEELLNNFSQQKDAWKHSMYFISHTRNEYVMMYCMTMLEVRLMANNQNPFVIRKITINHSHPNRIAGLNVISITLTELY